MSAKALLIFEESRGELVESSSLGEYLSWRPQTPEDLAGEQHPLERGMQGPWLRCSPLLDVGFGGIIFVRGRLCQRAFRRMVRDDGRQMWRVSGSEFSSYRAGG